VKDPSEHAKRQVAELDKTAKRSKEKKKAMLEQVDSDTKEIARIDEQLAAIHRTYDPLVAGLADKQAKKANLVALLEKCKNQEKSMMGTMKGMVNENVVRNFKQNRNMASYKLEVERGFTVQPESTFRQGGSATGTTSLVRK
jgi:septal ring factor EnvC (AmiA/AmiB activator)